MAKKKIAGFIKLQIPAGSANPAPPVGPALGQRGINIQDFCRTFNEATADKEKGVPLPVVITAYEDRTFSFIVKTPPTTSMILKALGVDKGSPTPHTKKIGKLTAVQAAEIARAKMADMNTDDLPMAVRVVAGSARSMGVEVEEV
jgi:large subunit ribosomal protein L11